MLSFLNLLLPQGPGGIVHQIGWNTGNADEVHLVGIVAMALVAALALLVPRRWIALPMVLSMCLMPSGQRIILFTLDFTFLRLLLLVLWLRILVRSEFRPLAVNHLDRVFFVYVAVVVVTGTLLTPTVGGFVNKLGVMFDDFTLYLFFRHALRDFDDLLCIGRAFFWVSVPVLAFFLLEHQTGYNIFSTLGGVPEKTLVREGRLRCQGAFAHPILAGCFWALLLPIYVARGLILRRWIEPALACGVALALIVLCASSTPAMSVIFGLGAAACYLVRRALPWFRWMLVVTLIGLHLAMKSPVWSLIARVDIAGGSTGWHRYQLIDQAIRHFDEWYLVGTHSTAHWGWMMNDVANMYVGAAVTGGFATLVMFVSLIVVSFVGISRTMRSAEVPLAYKRATWAVGCMLFMHCTNFIGVAYFGQTGVLWHLTLAAAGSLTLVPGATRGVRLPQSLLPQAIPA